MADKNYSEEIAATREIIKLGKERTKVMEDMVRVRLQAEVLNKEILDAQSGEIELTEEEIGLKQDLLDIALENIETQKTSVKAQESAIQVQKERIKLLRLEVEVDKEKEEQSKKTEQALGGFDKVLKSIALRYTLVSSDAFKNSLTGQIVEMKKLGYTSKHLLKSMGEIYTAGNIGASILSKVKVSTAGLVAELFSARERFFATTGAMEDYTSVMTESYYANLDVGMSMGETSEAFAKLYTEMRTFTEVSDETQISLVKTVGALTKLGVSNAPKMLDDLVKAFYMTESAAELTIRQVAGLAKELNISMGKMTSDFASAMSMMAAHGDKGQKVFEGLQRIFKATGIEMQNLLAIVGQFDTFKGAAEVAGQLNAVLGGPLLNAIDLVNASEEKRISMLRQSLDLTNKSWDSLDKYNRLAIMNAAGIKDMTVANKLFGQSFSEYRKAVSGMKALAVTQEQLADAAKDATSFLQKVKLLGYQLAVLVEPIVSLLSWMVDGLLNVSKGMKWFGAVLAVLGIVLMTFGAKTALAAGTIKLLGLAGATAAPGLISLGVAGKMASPGVALFGASLAIVAFSVGLIVGSIGYLINSFANLFTSIGNLSGASFSGVVDGIKGMGSVLDELPMDKLYAFDSALTNTRAIGDSSTKIVEVFDSMTTVMQEAKNAESMNNLAKALNGLTKALDGGGSNDTTSGSSGKNDTTSGSSGKKVVLKIDDRVLGEVIVENVKELLNDTNLTLAR